MCYYSRMRNDQDSDRALKLDFNTVTQFLLPAFTLGAMLLISFKQPHWGLIMNLIAQIFWLYSGWKAWKKANQIGIFINAVVFTAIVIFGIINYWFIK